MELFAYPDRLGNLAVEAFGNYVSDLLVLLVSTPGLQHLKLYNAQETCSCLKEMIRTTVPASLADDLTLKLLKRLDLKYKMLHDTLPLNLVDEMAEIIVNAILHESVEIIDNVKDETHCFARLQYSFLYLQTIIFKCLNRLKRLKILRLGRVGPEIDWLTVHVSENLEELCFQGCNDDILKALSKSSKNLKRLDVKNSYVTDECIDSILKFQQLEALNIEHSCITQEGVTNILKGLAKTEEPGCHRSSSNQLKSFGCTNLTSFHIDIIVKYFPNITSLSLSRCTASDLSPLKFVKHLARLFVVSIPFCSIKELLEAIGGRLVSLGLDSIHSSDLPFIYKSCPMLQNLQLICCLRIPEYSDRFPLPQVDSVQRLEISLDDPNLTEYIIFRHINLKRLYVLSGASISLQKKLLTRSILGHLEEYLCHEIGFRFCRVSFYDRYAPITKYDFVNGEVQVKQHTCPVTSITRA